jgi:diguanylate cyclase (GGDEF)-like protein
MSKAAVGADDIDRGSPQLQERFSSWLGPLRDHDLVVVVNAHGEAVYAQPGRSLSDIEIAHAAIPQLLSAVQYMRGQQSAMPQGTTRLLGDQTQNGISEGVLMFNVGGHPGVVAALPLAPGAAAPVIVAVRFIEQALLSNISDRLRLPDLRLTDQDTVPSTNNAYAFTDKEQKPIARFVWLSEKPGATILDFVVPFIGIALASFALLSGLVMRYMRYTAATIAAGENQLRYLALHDPLCGLPNRNFFSERLEAAITSVQSGGAAAAVFYIDLDHFKDVNDTLGHPVGDELIRNATLRLSQTMNRDDLVARLGGDEFAVITSASADPATLQDIATRAIAALCAPYLISGHTIVIGASIGIAIIDKRTVSAADIMRYADMALYRAKNEGRNRACVYDKVMDADLSQRKLVEHELREAIDNDRLKVLYQPIFNASGEKVVGVEALARWPHPTRGLVSPAEFIPIAEHSGLIIELGARVLRRACLEGKSWPDITVSVNVSPLQFRRLDFVSMVERTLAETGFDPERLELELTESTLLGNLDSAEAAMHRLRALGVRLALDDFGTGYSSLLYLRRFPFNKLKIDRSFVLTIEKATDAAAIVHAIVSLGRGLGMTVTAEGVETAEQHLFLRAAGVHCMQGFRFGKPSDATEITERLSLPGPGIYRSIESDARAALAS